MLKAVEQALAERRSHSRDFLSNLERELMHTGGGEPQAEQQRARPPLWGGCQWKNGRRRRWR